MVWIQIMSFLPSLSFFVSFLSLKHVSSLDKTLQRQKGQCHPLPNNRTLLQITMHAILRVYKKLFRLNPTTHSKLKPSCLLSLLANAALPLPKILITDTITNTRDVHIINMQTTQAAIRAITPETTLAITLETTPVTTLATTLETTPVTTPVTILETTPATTLATTLEITLATTLETTLVTNLVTSRVSMVTATIIFLVEIHLSTVIIITTMAITTTTTTTTTITTTTEDTTIPTGINEM